MNRLTLSAAVLCLGAQAAFAHGKLNSSTPADRSSVAAPSEIDLSFSEALVLKFSAAEVTGPDKAPIATSAPRLKDGDKTLVVPLTVPAAPGAYRVEWHVLSTDGHKTKGTFSFTVAP